MEMDTKLDNNSADGSSSGGSKKVATLLIIIVAIIVVAFVSISIVKAISSNKDNFGIQSKISIPSIEHGN